MAQQVVVAAPDPGGHHAEAARQIEVADPLACEPAVRHEDPAEVERRAVEREVVVAAVPDVAAERLDRRLRTDHDHRVARVEAVARRRDRHVAVVLDTAEPEARVARAQLADRRQPGRRHVDRPVDQPLDRRRRWRWFEPRREPQLAAEQQREDRDHRRDRGRVGERVGDDRVAVGHGLGRGLERRGVRGAAGEQPGPVGGRQVEHPRHQRTQPGQRRDECGGDRHRERAATSHAGDERRSRRQTDRVGEQHEAELAEQSEAVGRTDRVVDRADGEADEQRRRRAERDPPDADAADTGADSDDEEDEQDRVVHQEVRHRPGL